jgi:molybdopterin synthase sulfur carrier subunit
MSIKVILFGKLSEIAGSPVSLNDVSDTDGLVKALHKNYPALAGTKYVIAVDKQVVDGNTVLHNNSIVALLPPFSGG